MKQSRIVGVGCFGRSQTFSEFIRKILERYYPGPVDVIALCKKLDSKADGLPDFIMTDIDAAPAERKTDLQTKTSRVTGLYISFICILLRY